MHSYLLANNVIYAVAIVGNIFVLSKKRSEGVAINLAVNTAFLCWGINLIHSL